MHRAAPILRVGLGFSAKFSLPSIFVTKATEISVAFFFP